jgi:L-cysteine/cystine lyase
MMRCVDLDAVRAELPVLARCAYLNTGTFGPLPRRTVEAMCARQYDELENGRRGRPYFEEVRGLRSQVREAIRELLNAAPESTALTRSTGDGCNIAVASLRLSLDDEIVTTDDEHFGLLGPLHVSGARVRVAAIRERPLDEVVAAIKAEISPRTRLLAVSHVTWTTGRVLPVRELADLPIPLLVDGAQGAGAVPVDVDELGCDFYTVSGQKWLLGPDGTGALYVRPEMIDRIHVPFPSYFSQQRHEATGAFVPAPGALRLEPGTLAAPALAGLLASLSFAAEVGEERFARARALTERCRELLSERLDVLTPPSQATLVSFRPRGRTAEEVVAALAERGIVVREFPGLDWIRASIGFWTSEEEIERLVEAL